MTASEIAMLFAGLFAGACVVLVYHVRFLLRQMAAINAERKRWANKAVIREGSPRLFPDSETEPDAVPQEKKFHKPFTVESPFRRGINNLKNSIAGEKKTEAGQNLPDELKEKIATAAEAAKQG